MIVKTLGIILIVAAVHLSEVKALKCYSCISSGKDWSSCNSIKQEVTCQDDENGCISFEGTKEGKGVLEKRFIKACTSVCDAASHPFKDCKKTYVLDGLKISCKANCCSDDLCNQASSASYAFLYYLGFLWLFLYQLGLLWM